MTSIIDEILVGTKTVTETSTVVLSPGQDEVTFVVERFPVTLHFDSKSQDRFLELSSISSERIIFSITGDTPGPYAFDAIEFLKTDDGRILTAAIAVDEITGDRGLTRVVHMTLTERADG